MKKKSQGSDVLYQSLIHLYNLLDLLKIGYINSRLLRSFSRFLVQLFLRSHSSALINTISSMILGLGYLVRCGSVVTQHNTTMSNSASLTNMTNETGPVVIFDQEHVYKQLASSRIDRIAQSFIFFTVNLGMFYITSFQIISLLLNLLTPLFPVLLCNTQTSCFMSLLCGLQITILKTQEFHNEQENTKRFTNLVAQQKISIQHPQQHVRVWLTRIAAIAVPVAIAFLMLQAPWLLYVTGAIAGITCIGWVAMNRKLISSHWLPYGTGLMSAISTYSSIKQIALLHRHLIPITSDTIVDKCIDRCGIALGLIYGYSIKKHETQHKCVETLLAIRPSTTPQRNRCSHRDSKH